MSWHCRVQQCRHRTTHTTKGHQCGRCGRHGHGQLECGNSSAMENLRSFFHIEVPLEEQCQVPTCRFRECHLSAAHKCARCGVIGATCRCQAIVAGATSSPPPLKLRNVPCPHCKRKSDVDLGLQVFTDAQCSICFDDARKVVFEKCAHALICEACVQRVSATMLS